MRSFKTFVCVCLFAASVARATAYSGTVLYHLTPASGVFNPSGTATTCSAAGGFVVGTGNGADALLWSSSNGSVDLTPSGFTSSLDFAINGNQEVGYGFASAANSIHALFWSGTAASAVDLNPSGKIDSTSHGLDGTQQVGCAGNTANGSTDQAYLWSGTSASALNLNPSGFGYSIALGTDINQQVGFAAANDASPSHAILWSGTAASAVDLSPDGFANSEAVAVEGTQQVGGGIYAATSAEHALLWTGTAASAVDLGAGYFANDTNGTEQVGYAGDSINGIATLWFGAADSATNLQALLPSSGTWNSSNAYTIDSAGNVFGVATGSYNNVKGTFAVEWSPVPEPGSLSLLAIGGIAMMIRRRRMT